MHGIHTRQQGTQHGDQARGGAGEGRGGCRHGATPGAARAARRPKIAARCAAARRRRRAHKRGQHECTGAAQLARRGAGLAGARTRARAAVHWRQQGGCWGAAVRRASVSRDEAHEAAAVLERRRRLLQAVGLLVGRPRLGQRVDLGANLREGGAVCRGGASAAVAPRAGAQVLGGAGAAPRGSRAHMHARAGGPLPPKGRPAPRPAARRRRRRTCRTPARRCPGSWTTPDGRGCQGGREDVAKGKQANTRRGAAARQHAGRGGRKAWRQGSGGGAHLAADHAAACCVRKVVVVVVADEGGRVGRGEAAQQLRVREAGAVGGQLRRAGWGERAMRGWGGRCGGGGGGQARSHTLTRGYCARQRPRSHGGACGTPARLCHRQGARMRVPHLRRVDTVCCLEPGEVLLDRCAALQPGALELLICGTAAPGGGSGVSRRQRLALHGQGRRCGRSKRGCRAHWPRVRAPAAGHAVGASRGRSHSGCCACAMISSKASYTARDSARKRT